MKQQTGSILIPLVFALILFAGVSMSLINTGIISNPLSVVSYTPNDTVSSQQPIKLQELTIDDITIANVTSSPNLKQTEVLADGSVRYRLYSPQSSRDDLAIFKETQLVFYRSVKLAADQTLPSLTAYQLKYGQPQQQLRGSLYYGPQATLMLYLEKGVAAIANTNTNEIYEEQRFKPTDLNNYLNLFGNDYLPTTNSIIEETY